MLAAKYFAGDDVNLEAKLHRNIQALTPQTAGICGNSRVDTLAAATLIKQLYPVKCTIFAAHTGLQELGGSNILLFEEYHQQKESTVMQLIILTVLVITKDYIDKTVILPGKGTFIKGIDTILLG